MNGVETRRAPRLSPRATRALRALVVLAPGLVMAAADWARRGGRLLRFRGVDLALYVATVACSLLLWGALLYVASSRRPRARALAAFAFVVLWSFAFAVQQTFFGFYRVYVNIDPLVFGDSIPRGIVATLPLGRSPLLPFLLVGVGFTLLIVGLARRVLRPPRTQRRATSIAAALLVVAVFALPVSPPVPREAAAPDIMYFHAVAVFVNEVMTPLVRRVKPTLVRVQRRFPEAVPPLDAKPPVKRNVVLLLEEAQRADVTCIAYDPHCALATRASNPLLPERFPFLEARSASSSTAVAVAVLWSGIDPASAHDRIYSTPLVWEYARAAGYDVAYWTSQNLMFGNARLFVQDVPLTCRASGSDLDPESNVLTGASDDALVDRVIADLGTLAEPFFAVVHFSNIHRPRVIDPALAPFQPTALRDEGTGGERGKNYYKNAVYHSDLAVARLVAHIRSHDVGKRTVLVYTSDHGEAWGEHDNENDHSSTVFDEEIRVPLYVDAAPGLLSPLEIAGYRANQRQLVSHYDVAASLFELLGFWDDPSFARFRTRMLGTPLDQPRVERPLPLTNVSWVWEYHRPNWGMMLGPFKVLAQPADSSYHCYNVLRDPREHADIGPSAPCQSLIREANREFGMLPKDMRRLRDRPDFGPQQ